MRGVVEQPATLVDELGPHRLSPPLLDRLGNGMRAVVHPVVQRSEDLASSQAYRRQPMYGDTVDDRRARRVGARPVDVAGGATRKHRHVVASLDKVLGEHAARCFGSTNDIRPVSLDRVQNPQRSIPSMS